MRIDNSHVHDGTLDDVRLFLNDRPQGNKRSTCQIPLDQRDKANGEPCSLAIDKEANRTRMIKMSLEKYWSCGRPKRGMTYGSYKGAYDLSYDISPSKKVCRKTILVSETPKAFQIQFFYINTGEKVTPFTLIRLSSLRRSDKENILSPISSRILSYVNNVGGGNLIPGWAQQDFQ
ncbi:hypothetical protein Tco_0154129 [Tanacetum coccineum]